MNRKLLIIVSVIADALDLMLVGQIPGIAYVIDIPVTAMHVAYAGPMGLLTLGELVPGVGTLPIYTVAAMSYPHKPSVGDGASHQPPPG